MFKTVIYVQSCCFANLNLFNLCAFSLPLTSSLFKRPLIIIIIRIVIITTVSSSSSSSSSCSLQLMLYQDGLTQHLLLQSKPDLCSFKLKSACDTPRCQNNGTCQSGFKGKKYRCLCPFGFTGEQCEHGKLFLKKTFLLCK